MDGPEKFLCVLAEYDRETEQRVENIRQRLCAAGFIGRQTQGIPHHITLGTFPIAEKEVISKLMKEAAAQSGPFSVTFSHLGVFGGGNVLFLAPDVNRELLVCKEYFGDSENWTPHTTLLIEDPSEICRAMPLALEAFEEFQGRVEGLSLYEFFPAGLICRCTLEI